MTEYLPMGLILMCLSCLFMWVSFKVKDEAFAKLFFYLGFVFVISSLFFGLFLSNSLVSSGGLPSLFIGLISLMLLILFLLIINEFIDKLKKALDIMLGK